MEEEFRTELVEYLETIKNNEDKYKEITYFTFDDSDGEYYVNDKTLQEEIWSKVFKRFLQGDINDWCVATPSFGNPDGQRFIRVDPTPWGLRHVDLFFHIIEDDESPEQKKSCDNKKYTLLLQLEKKGDDEEREDYGREIQVM